MWSWKIISIENIFVGFSTTSLGRHRSKRRWPNHCQCWSSNCVKHNHRHCLHSFHLRQFASSNIAPWRFTTTSHPLPKLNFQSHTATSISYIASVILELLFIPAQQKTRHVGDCSVLELDLQQHRCCGCSFIVRWGTSTNISYIHPCIPPHDTHTHTYTAEWSCLWVYKEEITQLPLLGTEQCVCKSVGKCQWCVCV